ncbi:MAG: glucosamine-6-phosphate deaminase [Lachnospiraceae bacterium]|jgi:glucosamine-6-phosphate deaminase|nr:glucosamine-6-phosphate deaminase [Lachnospiraceae bacterium]
MRFIKTDDYEGMSKAAAAIVTEQIKTKPSSVLGLATGGTPVRMYELLIKAYEKGELDFSQISTVNLDEYKGITRDNEQSYFYYMNERLWKHTNIDPKRTHVPDGMVADAEAVCLAYEQTISDLGGIDLQILGIGHNGHIGFNEPGDVFEDRSFCVELSQATINANQRFFATADDVPKEAYTVGIGTIMSAAKIVVMISGEDKAAIVKEAFTGPVTPKVPASILRFHRDVTVIGDAAALGLLPE